MAVSFPRTTKGRLSLDERSRFYNIIMKQVVVVVESEWKEGVHVMSITGGGFTLKEMGYIMTAAHIIHHQSGIEVLYNFRRVNDNQFWGAKVVFIDRKLDVAILKAFDGELTKIERLHNWTYAKLGDPINLSSGTEVIMIGHPSKLWFSMAVGELAFDSRDVQTSMTNYYRRGLKPDDSTPSCRLVGDVRREVDIDISTHAKHLAVMQINNTHSSTCSSGAPIFSSSGSVIGIMSFVLKRHDFAIPIFVIRNCLTTFRKQEDDKYRKTVGQERKRQAKEENVNPKRKRHRHR